MRTASEYIILVICARRPACASRVRLNEGQLGSGENTTLRCPHRLLYARLRAREGNVHTREDRLHTRTWQDHRRTVVFRSGSSCSSSQSDHPVPDAVIHADWIWGTIAKPCKQPPTWRRPRHTGSTRSRPTLPQMGLPRPTTIKRPQSRSLPSLRCSCRLPSHSQIARAWSSPPPPPPRPWRQLPPR